MRREGLDIVYLVKGKGDRDRDRERRGGEERPQSPLIELHKHNTPQNSRTIHTVQQNQL